MAISARFRDWLARAPDDHAWKRTGASCHRCRAERLCASRGCDGTVQRRIVWHDGARAVLRVCPVLFITPEAEEAINWFDRCYTAVVGFNGVAWQRVALPFGGAMGDQPARLLEALEYLRTVYDTLAREAQVRSRKARQDKERKTTTDGERD